MFSRILSWLAGKIPWLKWAISVTGPLPAWPIGKFNGAPNIAWHGPLDYTFFLPQGLAVFEFTRANGEVIKPTSFDTDGGSIPRFLWELPDMDPWTFFPAYVLHDWLFDQHHQGLDKGRTLEDANAVLMEGIVTLLATGAVEKGRYTDYAVRAIWEGVSSPLGAQVWDKGLSSLPGGL